MEDEYDRQCKTLFEGLPPEHAPKRLVPLVLERVAQTRRRAALMSMGITAALGIGSGVIFISAIAYMLAEISQSSFDTYLALAFSDSGTLILYWKEFGITLLEALPTTGIMLVLLALLIFLSALRFVGARPHAIITHQFA